MEIIDTQRTIEVFLLSFYQKNTKSCHFKGVYVSNQQENIILISFIKNNRHKHKKKQKRRIKKTFSVFANGGGKT